MRAGVYSVSLGWWRRKACFVWVCFVAVVFCGFFVVLLWGFFGFVFAVFCLLVSLFVWVSLRKIFGTMECMPHRTEAH